ncbi:MAG TPA: hypothetical protein VIL46_19015 [Gemmataceae bacterium]
MSPPRAPPSPVRWRAFAEPKGGHRRDEYEDGHAGDAAAGRFAVTDGASESTFAGRWAELLARGFVAAGPGEDWLDRCRADWAREFGPGAAPSAGPLPWYAELKRDEGAFATFLGLELGRGSWRACAVGDACLFHLRGGAPEGAFPVTRAADFTNRPALLGSRPPPGTEPGPPFRRAEGRAEPGDHFLLATDALAHWCLQRHEQGSPPWGEVLGLWEVEGEAAFADWVARRRASDGLRNDDVTLILIELCTPARSPPEGEQGHEEPDR